MEAVLNVRKAYEDLQVVKRRDVSENGVIANNLNSTKPFTSHQTDTRWLQKEPICRSGVSDHPQLGPRRLPNKEDANFALGLQGVGEVPNGVKPSDQLPIGRTIVPEHRVPIGCHWWHFNFIISSQHQLVHLLQKLTILSRQNIQKSRTSMHIMRNTQEVISVGR